MRLVWKLLRQHISIPQFAGFFLANLIGMVIIMLGIQFYADTQSIYNGEDSFMKADYIIINKQVGALSSLTGNSGAFTAEEIEDLREQSFVEQVGTFTPSAFNVRASFDMDQLARFSTDMFFESVPDEFVDVASDDWQYHEGDTCLSIILPKNYLDLYNFGFAQSRNMPKLSEGILGALRLQVWIDTPMGKKCFTGRIAGFSSRLNTILVPESFMTLANKAFAPDATVQYTRLIVKVNNPTDEAITAYLNDNGYETDAQKLNASKTTFVLRVIIGIVMGVGLIICLLSFYILMLSVYLLVEKNNTKLENLLVIGYSPARVSLPYQALTVGLNLLVMFISFALLFVVRSIYISVFQSFFPDMEVPSIVPSIVVGVLLFIVVSVFNVLAIRAKIRFR